MTSRFVVVAGSGKTSLVEALAAEGVAHVPEAERAIIRDQFAVGGQSAEEAEAMGCTTARIYNELGYERVPLPLAPIPGRSVFVRAAFETERLGAERYSAPSLIAPGSERACRSPAAE